MSDPIERLRKTAAAAYSAASQKMHGDFGRT